MAYFKITYFVHDEINTGMIYELKPDEAKAMVLSWQGKLIDIETNIKQETPTEWLEIVEKNTVQEKTSDEWIQTLEELQELYVEKFGKQLSPAYKNNIEWIKGKLYS